ncbi:amino acid transporter heavy chain SLC3A2 [Aulostomus maculatus]
MPLNAGDAGYGSVASPGLSGSVGATETAPLLIPELEPVQPWRPMNKEELESIAGGPGWRKARCYLVLLFWLAWVSILATAIVIIVKSPRPVVASLKWWQKSLFYQLQPDLTEAQTRGSEELCQQLPYLKSLGIEALILEGLFAKDGSPSNATVTGSLGTLPQIQHLLRESNKAGLKVVLDFCDVELFEPQNVTGATNEPTEPSAAAHALRFWLEQNVAGFAICDTDAAYSEQTLLMWRSVLKEFSNQEEEERILMVIQTREVLPPPNNSSQTNVTLVDVVMRSLLPNSSHILSAQEVTDAVETHLQTTENIWPSWTVGGEASPELKKLLLVLIMTLPGSPAVRDDQEFYKTRDKDKKRHLAVALFTSLGHSRAREEALLYGSFTFLPFNTSSSSNSSLSTPSSPPILAFLRSWGCVHFLVLLNIGPVPHTLDPAWAPSLPEAGVFVTSTGMDRLGSTSLYTLTLQPHEAIVIKLFEAGSYS